MNPHADSAAPFGDTTLRTTRVHTVDAARPRAQARVLRCSRRRVQREVESPGHRFTTALACGAWVNREDP